MKNSIWMSSVVVAIACSGSAVAADAPTLYCDPPVAAKATLMHRAACEEVFQEVKQRFPSATLHEGVVAAKPEGEVLRLDILKLDENAITGRLAWSAGPNAAAGYVLGPVITTTITDATLNDRSLREFARGLVGASNIQFRKS